MVADGQIDLVRRDAGPVVGHPNGAQTTTPNLDPNLAGTGIESIIQQLACHRDRSFDHLTGGDPLYHLGWENLNGARPVGEGRGRYGSEARYFTHHPALPSRVQDPRAVRAGDKRSGASVLYILGWNVHAAPLTYAVRYLRDGMAAA